MLTKEASSHILALRSDVRRSFALLRMTGGVVEMLLLRSA
ncbi:MAG: hypothetical protein JWR44_1021 [Hymenobacter sp.]|jgi:hypothetical protein|nr:hypothetical protein [Hymenobacter sp.]